MREVIGIRVLKIYVGPNSNDEYDEQWQSRLSERLQSLTFVGDIQLKSAHQKLHPFALSLIMSRFCSDVMGEAGKVQQAFSNYHPPPAAPEDSPADPPQFPSGIPCGASVVLLIQSSLLTPVAPASAVSASALTTSEAD